MGEAGKSILGRGKSMCKGPGVGTGTARRLVWLEGRQRLMRVAVSGPHGALWAWEDCEFYSE